MIIKSVRMICANLDNNNNKFWDADVHDDGNVYVRYGRVGYSGQEEGPFPGGEKFLEKKIKEKKKKGYTEFEGLVIDKSQQTISVNKDLKNVAKSQIQFNSVELEKLVERLVAANIHNIVSNTKIQYDVKTGLFSTPLGIITPDMIKAARSCLADIKHDFSKGDLDSKEIRERVQSYLMLVPHDFGMRKLNVQMVFPDQNSFDKELNILDSLEASYTNFQGSVITESKDSTVIEEKIFNVKLAESTNVKNNNDIVKWFESSKKKMHGYDNIKVVNIYEVDVEDMTSNFDKNGLTLGNIHRVFHGTSEANLLSILKSGLRISPPSTAYIAGKMFGNGVYGAIHSSKALGYTLGRWGGSTSSSGWLFICDFAMGAVYEPTQATSGGAPKGYDSIWAYPEKTRLYHDELIVFKNEQIKITHLLECK